MRSIILIIPSLFFLSGCLPFLKASSNPGAYDGVSAVYPEATQPLADEAAKRLGAGFPSRKTFTVNTGTEFGQALEGALLRDGFQVAPQGTPVRYNVDMLQDAVPPAAYVSLFVPEGTGQDGLGISHTYTLDSLLRVPPPAAGAAGNNYLLEASPDKLMAGQSTDVTFTLKKAGRPVSGGFKPHFERHPNFPNLRDIVRTLDKNGCITVRGLWPAKPEQSYLRMVLDPETHVDAAVTVVDKQSITVAELPPLKTAPVAPVVVTAPAPAVVPTLPALPEAAAPLPQGTEWRIAPGLLRGQLAAWSGRAGYQLVWKAGYDFDMESQTVFRGDFIEAVKRLFMRMHEHGNLLRATIYQDNRVLEVKEE